MRWPRVIGLGATCWLVTACTTSQSTNRVVEDKVVVFAASSLTESFLEIGQEFIDDHPEVDVVFNFAGSAELVSQLAEGAPADIFAAADQATMDRLVAAEGHQSAPVAVASNTFAILVGPGNPARISRLADLADPGLIVVLCAESVPCGTGAAAMLANAGVELTPASYEDKVKAVVNKVTTGEADAGIVYVTDVLAAVGQAVGVEIPADENVTTTVSMAVTAGTSNSEAARRFIDFVASPQGREILRSHGFGTP